MLSFFFVCSFILWNIKPFIPVPVNGILLSRNFECEQKLRESFRTVKMRKRLTSSEVVYIQLPWNSTDNYFLNAILLLFFNTPKLVHSSQYNNFILVWEFKNSLIHPKKAVMPGIFFIAKCSTQNYNFYLQNVMPICAMCSVHPQTRASFHY